MKEICDQWKREMASVRIERRMMLGAIIALVGVKLYL